MNNPHHHMISSLKYTLHKSSRESPYAIPFLQSCCGGGGGGGGWRRATPPVLGRYALRSFIFQSQLCINLYGTTDYIVGVPEDGTLSLQQ